MSMLAPCEMEEDSPALAHLREIVEEYDELFERCMDPTSGPLSPEDQKDLDDLHGTLILMEHDRWGTESYAIFELMINHTDLDFPIIRYELGMLPNQHSI